MTTSSETIQKVVEEVFQYISEHDPESFEKLNADKPAKDELITKIKQVAEDEILQGKELERNGHDLTKLDLPPGRLEDIENGLKMTTYRVEIVEKVAKVTFVDGTDFMTIHLDTLADINYASYVQIASIIIEGVLLVLTVIGLKVPISNAILKKTTKLVVGDLQKSSAFRQAVTKFVESWDSTSSFFAKAKALFYLLKDTYSLGMLWNIIKTLCSNMGWLDWLKAAALIAAQLVAAFATGGLALIAKIALALKSAYDFVQKIRNLNTLKEMK